MLADEDAKLKLRRALVWDKATAALRAATVSVPLPKKLTKEEQPFNLATKPGSKAYAAFNQG